MVETSNPAFHEESQSKREAVVLLDHLSSFPNDCLVDIFERLDHDDIDEFCTLSSGLSRIADSSRKNAVKVAAKSLWVAQIDERNFELGVDLGGQKYTLRTSNEDVGLFKQEELFGTYDGFSIEKQIPTITEAVTMKAAAILHRFHFNNLEFHKICIDEHFLEFFKHLSPSSLRMKFVRFDDNVGKESFGSALLSGRLKEIILDWIQDSSFFDERFLAEYAQSVSHPRLTFNDVDEVEPVIYPNQQFAHVLSKYERIESSDRLIIDTNWVMSAVLTRLRDRRKGRWRLQLTRNIDQADVDAALRDGGPYSFYVGRRRSWGIRFPGTQHEVYVKSVDGTLDATFR